jgi:hypothetical protein
MKKFLLIFFIISNHLLAQSEKPVHEWYSMNTTELIFSNNNSAANLISPQNIIYTPSHVVRFTAFLHLQGQSHYNFTNHFGLYTGLGIRNVGLINHYDYNGDEISIKQRSYSLGVPLAFKFGNVVRNRFIALGAELEWMFAYKMKVLYKGQKLKNYEWFSNNVNAINPSVFAEIHFSRHTYLKAKYYLKDFLANKTSTVYLPFSSDTFSYTPTSSKIFYISIGTTVLSLKKKHETKKTV